jgi:hypothetical protein
MRPIRLFSSYCYGARFFGAFAELRKATISFVTSARLSVWSNSAPTRRIFMKFDMSIFRKTVEKIQVPLKSGKNNGYFTWRPIHIFFKSRSFLLRMRNVSDRSCRDNRNTHFLFGNFLRNSCRLWDNVGKKYCRAGQATDDNMAHAHWKLDN